MATHIDTNTWKMDWKTSSSPRIDTLEKKKTFEHLLSRNTNKHSKGNVLLISVIYLIYYTVLHVLLNYIEHYNGRYKFNSYSNRNVKNYGVCFMKML